MAPLFFLMMVLLAGIILFAVVAGGSRRPRGGRHGRRNSSSRSSAPRLSPGEIADRWSTIQAMAAGGGNGLRAAINEADKLLDHAMRQQGIAGDTMGDRLKSARSRFSDRDVYNDVWRAHKLRNALAHEVGFDLVPSQAHEALRDFERGLRTLGAL